MEISTFADNIFVVLFFSSLKYLSFKLCFVLYFLFNVITLLHLLFLEVKSAKSYQSRDIIREHSARVESVLTDIIDNVYEITLNLSEEILKSKHPEEKIAEINSKKEHLLADWLNYDTNDNYKIEYSVVLDSKNSKEILIGKPWIKRDQNGVEQYMLPVGSFLKNENHSGMLMLHFALDNFLAGLKGVVEDESFTYYVLNQDMKVIASHNLSKPAIDSFSHNAKDFYTARSRFTFHTHYLNHLDGYPVVVYYIHSNKLDLKNNERLIVYSVIALLNGAIFFSVLSFFSSEASRVKVRNKKIYSSEFTKISKELKDIHFELDRQREISEDLKSKNENLQRLNQTYFFDKSKAFTMLQELESESNKRFIENITLREKIEYLQNALNRKSDQF